MSGDEDASLDEKVKMLARNKEREPFARPPPRASLSAWDLSRK